MNSFELSNALDGIDKLCTRYLLLVKGNNAGLKEYTINSNDKTITIEYITYGHYNSGPITISLAELCVEYKTYEEWNKAGYFIIKGSKASTFNRVKVFPDFLVRERGESTALEDPIHRTVSFDEYNRGGPCGNERTGDEDDREDSRFI